MKQKLFTLLLAVVASVGTMFAASGTCGENLTWDLTDGVLTISGSGAMTDYSYYIYYGRAPWYSYRTSIASAIVENGVTSIGSWAFDDCNSLTSVTIPNSVTSIGEHAFWGCSALKTVTLNSNAIVSKYYPTTNNFKNVFGDQVTSYIIGDDVTAIGQGAFSNCTNLKELTIGKSITSINELAFSGCTNLKTVTLNSNAIVGKDYSLSSAMMSNWFGSQVTKYIIGNDVTRIGNHAFYPSCDNVTMIVVGRNVTSIGQAAFFYCGSLGAVSVLAETPPTISTSVFPTDEQLHWFAKKGSIYVPCGTLDAYKNSWTRYEKYIKYNPTPLFTTTASTNIANAGKITIQATACETVLEVTNNYGYYFTQWSDGVTANPRTVVLTKDTTFTAEFAINQYSIKVSCDEICGHIDGQNGKFDYNTTHTYRAVPNYGYHFVQWSDGVTTNPRTITLTKDETLEAIFSKNTYIIQDGSNSSMGSISGVSQAAYLDNVTLTASPKYGYHFTQWSDGVTANPRTFVITQDTIFTAEFAIDKSGTCGKNNLLQWAFADSGTLTISGNGELTENYTYGVEAPSKMQNLIIEEGITSIGKSAFSGCNALRTVTLNSNAVASKTYTSSSTIGTIFGSQITQYIIGNNITSIGDFAFYNCTNITSFILGDNLTTIGRYAFRNCTGLTSVDIPNNVMSIGYASFYDCSGLTSITLGNNVQTIEDWAFRGCSGLTNINIPNSVKSIGGKAFCVCSGLTSIEIPNSVTSLGAGAFLQCTNLQSAKISTNVSELSGFLFAGCINLGTLSFSSNVTSFGDSLFYNCQSLTMMIVPDKVTSIGAGMAANCKNIRKIIIGKSVNSIGQNAFTGCNNVKTVEWNAISCAGWNFGSQVETYTFGEEVRIIPANLCSGMNKLTEIKIPETVLGIGDNAFKGCANITSLALPARLTIIGKYAFANINNRQLTSLVMPAELQTIGDYAFSNNTYVESIDFNAKLQSVGAYAFKDCYRVSEMTCLATVTPNVGTDALASINSYASLCVPAECLRKYQVDPNWGRFDLCELGTTSTVTENRTVTVEPTDNTAIFTWPTENNAASYSLQITKDGVVFCTLVFNSNGQLTGIAFAPSRNGSSHAPAATTSVAGMSFTVTGLNVASKYAYRLAVADDAREELIAYRGEFATTGYDGEVNPGGNPEGIEDVFTDEHKASKILRDGQIYILRGEKTYTLQGQEVK